MPRILGVTKARQNFAELIGRADEHGEPTFIVHFNEPRAVVLGYEAYERLLAYLEDLEDTVAIYRGREEPARPLEDFLTELEVEAEAEGRGRPVQIAADSHG